MIPCFECICLAICKNRSKIDCSILHEYMDENTEYEAVSVGGDFIKTETGIQVWKEVESLFEKEHTKVVVDSDNSFDSFTIYAKGKGREDYLDGV